MPSVDTTLGAAFVGFSLSIFVLGILSAQVYTYYQRYPLDKPAYKFLVAGLWVLEVGHTVLTGHFFYVYAISNWGNGLILLGAPIWSIIVQVPLGAFMGLIVKCCFAMRVWRFSGHNIWITGLLVVAVLGQCGCSIWYTVVGFNLTSLTNIGSLFDIATVSLALGAFTDILTALTLSWYLRRLKTGYKHSDSIINRLIIYAINTGMLTSTISAACLVCYDLMPTNYVFIACYFVLSKLYANSLMATLNTRTILKGRGTDRELETVPTFVMMGNNTELPRLAYTNRESRFAQDFDQDFKSEQKRSPVQVGVHREVSFKADDTPSPSSAYTSTVSDVETGQNERHYYATAW